MQSAPLPDRRRDLSRRRINWAFRRALQSNRIIHSQTVDMSNRNRVSRRLSGQLCCFSPSVMLIPPPLIPLRVVEFSSPEALDVTGGAAENSPMRRDLSRRVNLDRN